jgi:hypothetical protein
MGKVQMISPDGQVSIISEAAAFAIRNNAFIHNGHVVVRVIENGVVIEKDGKATVLTLIDDDDR